MKKALIEIPWKRLPAGLVSDAQNLLWADLGESAGAVSKRLMRDPKYRALVVSTMLNGGEAAMPTPVAHLAREPMVAKLGTHEVDYTQEFSQKVGCATGFDRWKDGSYLDKEYPDMRTGKRRHNAYAVRFEVPVSDEELNAWCARTKRSLATPKEGIDIIEGFKRASIEHEMPLVLAGQSRELPRGRKESLCFRNSRLRNGRTCPAYRYLTPQIRRPGEKWGGHWWFLVLREVRNRKKKS